MQERFLTMLFTRLLTFFITLSLLWGGFASGASAPEELKNKIDEKAKELEAINGKIQSTQQNLTETKQQGSSLKSELTQITYDINRLGLSIKSSEINIQKLSLELEGLGYDIADVQTSIGGKKEAIAKFLRELQQNDADNLLVMFLKNKSLADGIFTAQSLADLNQGLTVEIANLNSLFNDLDQKIDLTGAKKTGIERESVNLKSRKGIVEDKREERQSLLSQTKNREQLYQQQLRELEKQQEETIREVEQLEFELRRNIDLSRLPAGRSGVLLFPVPEGRLTQGYGKTDFAARNYRGQYHNGVDIGKFLGAEVLAAESGIVLNVGDQDKYCPRGAYGKYIVIKHPNGLTTLYAHLSRQIVSVGQQVSRGQIIGYMGKSGWATGPHLHLTVYDSLTYTLKQSRVCGPMPVGGDLNPMVYL
ncbi:MAG: peptidoglycan DD-metalloendopeptidase family protein [bacterium]|nr:peptidoglycan DD-metalloendopeptidase family protein [bacterium]